MPQVRIVTVDEIKNDRYLMRMNMITIFIRSRGRSIDGNTVVVDGISAKYNNEATRELLCISFMDDDSVLNYNTDALVNGWPIIYYNVDDDGRLLVSYHKNKMDYFFDIASYILGCFCKNILPEFVDEVNEIHQQYKYMLLNEGTMFDNHGIMQVIRFLCYYLEKSDLVDRIAARYEELSRARFADANFAWRETDDGALGSAMTPQEWHGKYLVTPE